ERSRALDHPHDLRHIVQRDCVMLNRAALVRLLKPAGDIDSEVVLSGIDDANWLIHFRGAARRGRHVSGCYVRGLCRGVQMLSQRRPKEIALAESEAKQKCECRCDSQK